MEAGRIRKIDFFLIAVIVIGTAVFAFKCRIAYPIKWIGDTDEAAYVEMADNLIHGKGLSNDYIQYSYFFSRMKYPDITHPDAHYAPLYSLLIAPFFLMLGKSAFAGKIPAMLISSIFLPVFLYLLTKRLSRSRIAGFAAALGVIVFPAIFSHSLIPDDDAIFHFIVIASCYFIIKAQDKPKYYYPAGAFIGLAYYAKGNGLVLIPVYLAFCVIIGGFKALRNWKMWYCFAVAFLVMLPWFIRNTVHFHNPVFSTQQYAAGYIGYKGWEEGTYTLYWDKEMPSLLTKFRQAGAKEVLDRSLESFGIYLRWSFIGINGSPGAFTGVPAIAGLLLFFASCFYYLFRRPSVDNAGRVERFFALWHNRDIHVLWMVELSLMIFLALTWQPLSRLAFPIVAINMAIGWTTLYIAAKRIFKWKSEIVASCLIALFLCPVLLISGSRIYNNYKNASFPYGEGGQSYMKTGAWIKENLPGSIMMFREPGQLHFYSEEKGVQVPLAELEDIIKVMKFYKVTHIIPKVNMRPALKPLVEGKVPGFKLIYSGGLEIYEIQYDRLPATR